MSVQLASENGSERNRRPAANQATLDEHRNAHLPADDDVVTLAGTTIVAPGIGRAVRGAMSNEITRILAAHGFAAFENPRRATCMHEAGHAVISTWLGKHVTRVTTGRCVQGWTGFTHCADGEWRIHPDDANAPQTLIAVGRNLYAGIAAEMMFARDDFREGSSLDEVVMSQLAAQMAAGDEDGETLWRSEVHLPVCVHLKRNERVVRRIAGYLLEHRKIQGRPLERMLAGVQA
jgi:hypothetical protein